jgi:hypothetical protein
MPDIRRPSVKGLTPASLTITRPVARDLVLVNRSATGSCNIVAAINKLTSLIGFTEAELTIDRKYCEVHVT